MNFTIAYCCECCEHIIEANQLANKEDQIEIVQSNHKFNTREDIGKQNCTHILLTKVLQHSNTKRVRCKRQLLALECCTHVACNIFWCVECSHIFRYNGACNFNSKENTCENVHWKHSNEEKPSNLEDGRSEVDNTIVFHNPATITDVVK